MEHCKAVLFDLDDTITDRALSLEAVSKRMWQDFGERMPGITNKVFTGALIEADQGGYRPRDQMFEELLARFSWTPPPEISQLVDYWVHTFSSCCAARNGLEDLLATLMQRGIKLGIVSNGGTKMQSLKLKAMGLDRLFDVVVISEEAGVAKPDPAIFGLALERLGVEPEEAVFVGDNPTNDVAAAHALGMRTLWLKTERSRWPEEIDRCGEEIKSLLQVLELLP